MLCFSPSSASKIKTNVLFTFQSKNRASETFLTIFSTWFSILLNNCSSFVNLQKELRTESRQLKNCSSEFGTFLIAGNKILEFFFADRKSPSLSFQMTHNTQILDEKWRFYNDFKSIKRKQTPCITIAFVRDTPVKKFMAVYLMH